MDDVEALSTIVALLKQLEPDAQKRVLHSVNAFLNIAPQRKGDQGTGFDTLPTSSGPAAFSRDRSLSPKDFLHDKRPVTDIERVACLAYYLANYRDTPHFKTIDISALNTEAAQPKFSNASVSVDNAKQAGLLVPATKGNKQISAAGEKYVELLPDREAAREALKNYRPRRLGKKSKLVKIL
jgi:hypothetical protein